MTGSIQYGATRVEMIVDGELFDITSYLVSEPAAVEPLEPQCIECVEPDEDPAPWCDCRHDETCGDRGPCRRRAHDPARCPTPGRW